MEFAGVAKAERISRAEKLLAKVWISDGREKQKPGKLSGGEQQRVAIARALANKPNLILADEPTGNLDDTTGKMIFDLLHELSRKENVTIVAVTHDLDIAGRTDISFKISDGKLVDIYDSRGREIKQKSD
jgi:putative ABC transport system ATP-binding protein